MINPAHEVTAREVANEQIEAVGGLIEPAITKSVTGHRAGAEMLRLGAGEAAFVVPAVLVGPISSEFGAGRGMPEAGLDITPGRNAVFVDVLLGYLVRDSLVAESGHEPIEDGRRKASGHRADETAMPGFGVNLVEEGY